MVLTPRTDPNADRMLAADLRARLQRPIDVHVDQLHVDPNGDGVEAAQIARANSASQAADADRQQRAVASVALIAGVQPDAVTVDTDKRVLSTTASALPGLPIALYRLLEQRASRGAPGWTVRIIPPVDAVLPSLPIAAGVISDDALQVAAWSSRRDKRTLLVNGGTREQRLAVAGGVGDRGGEAAAGTAGGPLRFMWSAEDATTTDQSGARAKEQAPGT